jgi:hypothetical protein
MNRSTLALPLLLLAACQQPEPAPPQATAIVVTEIRAGAPLDEILQLLDDELAQAMAGELEGDALQHFNRAEAISDRLLEARLPFEWIEGEQYSIKARLRQIQSGADRVFAQIQTGTPRDIVMRDLRLLRADVVRLRQQIAAGGGRAPPALEDLLRDTAPARPRPRPAPADTPAVPVTVTGG